MNIWIIKDLLAFAISFVLAGIIIPQILLIAFRKNLFDNIDERTIHRGIVPRLGGIAFAPAIFFALACVLGFDFRISPTNELNNIIEEGIQMLFMVCAVLLMFLVGIADDLIGVRYRAKLLCQIFSAVCIVASELYVDRLYGFLWLHQLPEWLSWIVTGFAVVFVVNAINLIDGIDGLASGLSSVAFFFYSTVLYKGGDYLYSMLGAATVGTLFPFFYYNVFGNPTKQKKIFMGDTGALTTGMIMVFCAISVLHIHEPGRNLTCNPMVLALSPLIIPCFDVVRVFFHRMSKHRNPFLPDRCHIHHKLLALGFNQRTALIVILSWSALFIIMNMWMSPAFNPTVIIAVDAIVWIVVNVIISRAIVAREKKIHQKLYD